MNDGTIAVISLDLQFLVAGGYISVDGALSGTGEVTLQGPGAQVTFASSVGSGQTVDFLAGKSELNITLPQFFAATIDGFAQTDTIELGVGAAGIGYANNELTLQTNGGQTFDLAITGPYSFGDFSIVDNATSTAITVSCFAAGTHIRPLRGDIPVETLHVGDIVDARFAGDAPIKWTGRRKVDCAGHPRPRAVWPVCVRAGAFGSDQPRRDLLLSPDHAVFVNEVLIPIKCLINGTSVTQLPTDKVTYFHIELEHHDVLLAEGLPVETFLDTGGRADFANGGIPTTLFPEFTIRVREAMGCAPLIVTGPELDTARMLLESLAPKSLLASVSHTARAA